MPKNQNAKRYNKLSLDDLSSAVQQKEKIDISNQDAMKANRITVIKRDGRKQPFQPEKMRNVCLWACENKDWLADELIKDTEIKLHKEIHIKDMFQQLIVTAVNKISLLYPHWEDVAAKLELMAVYKNTYNISKSDEYPLMSTVLEKGLDHKIYDKKTVQSYTTDELAEIDKMIDPSRDLLFNYKGLVTFFDKYCLNYSKTKKLELPQHTYLRVAMALMIEETDRIARIKEVYDALSQHQYTKATPIMLNALTPGQQLSSCVLNTLADDSHSILDTGKNLGIYSKFKGGTALDISAMRAKGSYIEGNQGTSSGPVPFMRFYESIMKAWNQGCVSRNNYVKVIDTVEKNGTYSLNEFIEKFGTQELLDYSLKFNSCKINEKTIHITEAKTGDWIKSFDIEGENSRYNRIKECMNPTVTKDQQIRLTIEGTSTTIITSVTHPMCYFNKNTNKWEYKPSGDIVVGDKIKSEGTPHKINKVDRVYSESEDFIDFSVERDENYYVSNTKKEFFVIHNSKRPGALAIYFSWWHLDVIDILSLKSNGGTDENRARGLQYAIKLNQSFIDAVINDEEVHLFDPKDTPDLIGVVGEEFNKAYNTYINKSIKRKKIRARDLWNKIFKERSETGNIYLFHEENVNVVSMLNRYIGSSNLCLAGDTLVETDKGTKELKDIKIGDYVKSYNEQTETVEYKKVTDSALMNESAKVMRITDESGNSITCTPEHKVFIENRGYVEAKYLTETDVLKLSRRN